MAWNARRSSSRCDHSGARASRSKQLLAADRDDRLRPRQVAIAGAHGVLPPELDRIHVELRSNIVDQAFHRCDRLQPAIAAHRSCRHAARVRGNGADVALGQVVHGGRRYRGDVGDARRVVCRAATVERQIAGECGEGSGLCIDAQLAVDRDGVALQAELKLLEAIECKPHGAAIGEQAGQCYVVRQQRHVLAAERTAQVGEMPFKVLDGVGRRGVGQNVGNGMKRVGRRLHAEHQRQTIVGPIVPGETAFGLHEEVIGRLGLKVLLEHPAFASGVQVRANVATIGFGAARGGGVGFGPGGRLSPTETWRHNPSVLGGGVHIGTGGIGAADAGETVCTVGRLGYRACLLAEHDRLGAAQDLPRGDVLVETAEDEQRDRLAKISRRQAFRAHQIFREIALGPDPRRLQVLRRHHLVGLQVRGEHRQI